MEEERRGRREVVESSAYHGLYPWHCKDSSLGTGHKSRGYRNHKHPLPWMRARLSCIWMGTDIETPGGKGLGGLSQVIQPISPRSDHQLCLLHLFRSLRRNLPGKEAEKERFVDMLMDLSKRFPRMGFYFRSLIDNASFSTTLIGAVFRQVRRQEIMSLFSVFPLAQNPASL